MKLDLKKELKDLYKVSSKKVVKVKVPKLKIVAVEGKGSPASSDFKKAIETLYPVAYKIKFHYKKEGKDYSVMPLEGLWWAENMNDFVAGNKDNWLWKIFIVQPDFVSEKVFVSAVEKMKEEKGFSALNKIKFEELNEGMSAQILHIGPFSEEGPNIKKIHELIKGEGYNFDGLKQKHHEIYLSDMRKTSPEKLKTILRQPFIK